MSTMVKRVVLPEINQPSEGQSLLDSNYLNLISTVDIRCQVRLGSVTMTIAELRQLKEGQLLALEQKTNEPIDVLYDNQVIARGELISVEEYFGLHITEVCL